MGLSASNCGNSRETSRFATFASSVAYLLSTCRPSLYDEHDVWLNGSDVDNMPTSILEAYACGLTVASINPGGIPYIVEDGRTGRLVKCGDAKSLTETALEVIGNPALFCGTDTKRAGRVRELHLGFGEAGLDHRVSQLAPKGTSLYPRQTCT